MEQDNVSKEFAGLVGDVWHEWIDTRFYNNPTGPNGVYQYEHSCACGSGVWSNKKYYPTQLCTPNRNYTIELIKARIQAVPCGECGGRGEIKTGEKCMNHQCLSFSPCAMSNGDKDDKFNCPMIKPCSCTDGSDDWIKLCGWIVKNEVYTLDDGRTILANLFNILTTPALLMQAYIAYRRQADKCNGWCRTSKGPLEDMMSLHGAEMGLNVINKTCRRAGRG